MIQIFLNIFFPQLLFFQMSDFLDMFVIIDEKKIKNAGSVFDRFVISDQKKIENNNLKKNKQTNKQKTKTKPCIEFLGDIAKFKGHKSILIAYLVNMGVPQQ